MVSRCCSTEVHAYYVETPHYVCAKCAVPCDLIEHKEVKEDGNCGQPHH